MPTIPHIFATLPAGNVPASYLDDNFAVGGAYTPFSTGAVATTVAAKLGQTVSVFDFLTSAQIADVQAGTTTQGSLATAIQSAITAVQSTGQALYFPRGNYYCGTTGLTISGGEKFYGDGASNLLWSTLFTGTGLTVAAPYVILQDLSLLMPASTSIPASTLIGIEVTSNHCTMRNVIVGSNGSSTYQGWYKGIRVDQWDYFLTGCQATTYTRAFEGNGANAVYLMQCSFSAQYTSGQVVIINGGSGNAILGCDVEGAAGVGIYITDGGGASSGWGSTSITGCYIEGQTTYNIQILGSAGPGKNASGVSITGNYLSGLSTTTAAINANRVAGLAINGNNIIGQTTNSIVVGAVAINCNITGNTLNGIAQTINSAATGIFDNQGGLGAGTAAPLSWTPIDSSGAGLTFSTAIGSYTQIGRLIYWTCQVVYPNTADGSSSLIGGLPYSLPSGPQNRGACTILTDSSAIQVMQVDTTTTIRPYKTGLNRALNSDLSLKTLYMSGWYSL